jgi:enhancing lycopene biosynthesis protein 2
MRTNDTVTSRFRQLLIMRGGEVSMRVGILLGGCGLYDGSDVHETVLLQAALEERGERPVFLAPDMPQTRIIDHLTAAAVEGEVRNVLRESARLGRGAVRPLGEVRPDDLEALVIPGGYGPAVNFSAGFGIPGATRQVVPEVAAFLMRFLETGKPLGLVGLGEVPVRTLLRGPMNPPPPEPSRPLIDSDRPIIYTPGFAAYARLADVRLGIESMVEALLRAMEDRLRAPTGQSTGGGEGR